MEQIISLPAWAKQLKERWPSTVVARPEIGKFTGGAVSPGHFANEDSAGTGPKGRFILGKKTVYPVDSVIEWLLSRAKEPNASSRREAAHAA